jgi:hypothetical protein
MKMIVMGLVVIRAQHDIKEATGSISQRQEKG